MHEAGSITLARLADEHELFFRCLLVLAQGQAFLSLGRLVLLRQLEDALVKKLVQAVGQRHAHVALEPVRAIPAVRTIKGQADEEFEELIELERLVPAMEGAHRVGIRMVRPDR